MDFIGKIFSMIWAAITAYFHRQARQQFEEEQQKASTEAEQKREEKEDEVKKLDDPTLDKHLDKWMRD